MVKLSCIIMYRKFATKSVGIDVQGNITVSGTVDGRDLATDGTKLDGIEASATGGKQHQRFSQQLRLLTVQRFGRC